MAKIVRQVWLVHDLSTNEEYVSSMGPPYDDPDTYVLAGPVSVEFDVPDVARCPHCNKVLPEAEKPKLPLLPLVVGGVYRARDGKSVKIVDYCPYAAHPWAGDNERTYTDSGRQWMRHVSDNDLIERIA